MIYLPQVPQKYLDIGTLLLVFVSLNSFKYTSPMIVTFSLSMAKLLTTAVVENSIST